MTKAPVIVISSTSQAVGKNTIALNLAAAMWSEGYDVKLFAPDNKIVEDFLEKRRLISQQCQIDMPIPQVVDNVSIEETDKTVVIAIIPSNQNDEWAEVFYKAHTLISVGCTENDFNWTLQHPYINLIWQSKKQAAARGVKYLNWIVIQNMLDNDANKLQSYLQSLARQLGFRIAEPIYRRVSYQYLQDGYCTADMAKYRHVFKMSMDDVYARHEILNLTDDLWKHK